MADEQGYFAETPWTWRDRLRAKCYPESFCPLPIAPAEWPDCLTTTVRVELSWIARLQVLVSGKLTVQTKTVTEHVVGGSVTESVAYPIWK